jgi:hypothetical protein
MAIDMNIMGTPVTPDMIRRTIRQWHGANQTNGETLARKILNVPEDQNLPAYRIEQNQWPTLVYHPQFRSHMIEENPMDERTQARFLKKARNQAELDDLLKRGWLLKAPVAMNDQPPAELMPDDEFEPDSPYAAASNDDDLVGVDAAPIQKRRGRPPGSGKHSDDAT